jgi:hypothetical protein
MTSLMRPVRTRRSGIAYLLLLLYLPACTSWHVGTPTPAQFVETEHPQTVRVTRTDGTTLELKAPVVRGDSLVGTVGRDRTVSLALSDVRSVEVKRTSTGKTVLLVGAGVVVVVAVLLASLRSALSEALRQGNRLSPDVVPTWRAGPLDTSVDTASGGSLGKRAQDLALP